jgi:hypothetical protein
MGRACITNGEKRNACRILVRKPEETTRKTNNKMDLREIGRDNVDWINVADDGDKCSDLMNKVMKLGFHKILSS